MKDLPDIMLIRSPNEGLELVATIQREKWWLRPYTTLGYIRPHRIQEFLESGLAIGTAELDKDRQTYRILIEKEQLASLAGIIAVSCIPGVDDDENKIKITYTSHISPQANPWKSYIDVEDIMPDTLRNVMTSSLVTITPEGRQSFSDMAELYAHKAAQHRQEAEEAQQMAQLFTLDSPPELDAPGM